jgi:hypothetical protein
MREIAIVHEDSAHKLLVEAILKELKLNIDLVEFYPVGSKSYFFNQDRPEIKLLKDRVDNSIIRRILFLADADDS